LPHVRTFIDLAVRLGACCSRPIARPPQPATALRGWREMFDFPQPTWLRLSPSTRRRLSAPSFPKRGWLTAD